MTIVPAPIPALRDHIWRRFLRGPDLELLTELYVPALSCAVHYDRSCGYFSSSVLAVAARGFGKLIETVLANPDLSKPAVRLLVNEQLDPADKKALLTKGDDRALIAKLLKEFKNPTDALTRNRLEMLGWLVASGWLEIRVGIMRYHAGIAHAKFGLVRDAAGDELAFMGSDNESGAALTDNYEELEVQPGWRDPEFVENYRERFERLWDDNDEYVKTLPLPEAVRQKLIKFAPKGKTAPTEQFLDRGGLEAAMRWHFLAAAPYLPSGAYASDATAPVSLWEHQRSVVEDTASAFPSGRLLCDEVGMGKTIEAIMVLRRLLAGRGVRRALLLTPAGLQQQWQDELREKGGLLVPRWADGYLHRSRDEKAAMDAAQALATQPLLLISREWARLDNNRAQILNAPPWNLVLLDEAHAARRASQEEREFNSANLLLRLLRELQLRRRTQGILLLSATPMQTQPWEPWDLLCVLGVGGAWEVEFNDIRTYYDGVRDLLAGQLTEPNARPLAKLIAADAEFPPPPGLGVNDAQSLTQSLLFCPAENRQQLARWLRKGTPLGRRMHRNTRQTLHRYFEQGLLSTRPPRRKVLDEVFDFQDQAERDFYNAVGKYIDKRYSQLESEKPGKGFVMTIYRRRAASSPLAIRRSLQRRRELLKKVLADIWVGGDLAWEEQIDLRDLGDADLDEQVDAGLPSDKKQATDELREIEQLLTRLDTLGGTDSKLNYFWELLRKVTDDGRAVLIFTEYFDTLEYLRDQLAPTYGITLACYSGDGGQIRRGDEWVMVEKAEITARLRSGKINVLVCTDAASEGLNLQAASALINYDLPWNPSKVEQRIGRIDRIGQHQSELPIRNLFLKKSVDMLVYKSLQQRCGLFEHFVGRMQPVLARARDALRRNLSQSDAPELIRQLEAAAEMVKADEVTGQIYADADVNSLVAPKAPVTCADIEATFALLAKTKTNLAVRKAKESGAWQIGVSNGKPTTVSTSRETLETHHQVQPLTVISPLLLQLAGKLPLPPGRSPILFAEAEDGPFRAVEAIWITPTGGFAIESMEQLSDLIAQWDGMPPPVDQVLEVQSLAQERARRRVAQMKATVSQRYESAHRQQLEAARLRLLRELARTLRCVGEGDLNSLLQQQLARGGSLGGHYRSALQKLGGFPSSWPDDVRQDATRYVNGLTANDRKKRADRTSEIEAAINDPRWLAVANG